MTKQVSSTYIVIARQIIESDIFYNKPAEWFKIWIYILIKVRHEANKQFRRGEGYFCWSVDRADLRGITENQWKHCIEWLKKAEQIATQKTTRGNIIFVLNYAKYQDKENYFFSPKSLTEREAEGKQKGSRSTTIIKECNNVTTKEVNTSATKKLDTKKQLEERERIFMLVWSPYPKHRNKGQARKAFEKIKNPPIEKMLATIERMKETEDWKRENGKYIPYLSTWLNAEGWEDEAEVEIVKDDSFYVNEMKTLDFFKFRKKYGDDLAFKYHNHSKI